MADNPLNGHTNVNELTFQKLQTLNEQLCNHNYF